MSRASLTLLLLLLGLTVGLKLAVIPGHLNGAGREEQSAQAAMTAFLTRQGYRVEVDDGSDMLNLVAGVSGACTLQVANISPEGWQQDIVRQLAGPEDRVTFVYRGRTYPAQPRWRSWSDETLRKIGVAFGLQPPTRMVLGVIASPACSKDGLNWAEVSELT